MSDDTDEDEETRRVEDEMDEGRDEPASDSVRFTLFCVKNRKNQMFFNLFFESLPHFDECHDTP